MNSTIPEYPQAELSPERGSSSGSPSAQQPGGQSSSSDAQIPRVIGATGSLAIVAGSMLGIGIFLMPRVVAMQVTTPWLFLTVWAVGGLTALAGATAYAELGGLYPRSGGDYVFLRESLGPSVSHAAGWLLFFAVFTGSIAAMSVPLCQYQIPALLAPLLGPTEAAEAGGVGPWVATALQSPWAHRLLAVAIVIILTAVNAGGAHLSSRLQTVVIGLPIALLTLGALAILTGLSTPEPVAQTASTVTDAAATSAGTSWSLGAFGAAMAAAYMAVYFAYAGWNAVGYVGGEVKRPGRNIPLGLLGGTLLITALYLLLCWTFLRVLGLAGLRQTFEAGTAMARLMGGESARLLVTASIALAIIGSINGTILGGARIGYAMARDNVLPAFCARLGSKGSAPVTALWVQAAAACLLILTGTFETLVELTSIAMLVMGSLTVASLYILRRRQPDLPRPYRATGYPVLPALYLVMSTLVIGISILRAVFPASLGGDGSSGGIQAWYPLLGLALFAVVLLVTTVTKKVRRAGI